MFFGNRLVRTRLPGGVGAGGEIPPATRLLGMGVILWGVSPLYVNPVIVVMAGATFLFIKLKCDRSVKNRPFLFGSFFQS